MTEQRAEADALTVGARLWREADLASVLVSVDPGGLGGVSVRAPAGPVRDRWEEHFKARFGPDINIRPLPIGVSEDRLIGGIDLAATLSAGRPVAETGLLVASHGGAIIVRMAERMTRLTAAHIAAALDTGIVTVERSGMSGTMPARFAVVLLDEGIDPDEQPPGLLLDRLAFMVELDGISVADSDAPVLAGSVIETARVRLQSTVISDEIARSIDAAALSLGIASLRAFQFCLRAARAIAALGNADAVSEAHAALACQLVLGPRMQTLDMMVQEDAPPVPEPKTPDAADTPETSSSSQSEALEDRLVDAVKASASLRLGARAGARQRWRGSGGGGTGKAGQLLDSKDRGRPVGSKPGDPRHDGRLDLLATIRAGAPWQRIRAVAAEADRLRLRPADFRVRRYRHRAESVVIFVVDASGSSAMNRMAEAKGAVELLLSDCYSRRDSVALIAFRREGADLLLPPTRSLVRVRRSLAFLPGGGGTPLAAGLLLASSLAESERRKRKTPHLVILSDGKGNIALDGTPGRDGAQRDALEAAKSIRKGGFSAMVFDTSVRAGPKALAIAMEMGAAYAPLPFANSRALSDAVARVVAG